jgi:GNAT superfamily N-acetyltransferase
MTVNPGGVEQIVNYISKQQMASIRKAGIEDSSTIIGFQLKLAWETEQKRLADKTIMNGVTGVFNNPSRGQYYVAESNGMMVASLLITYEWSDWRNADVWWFQSVYVLPDYRRKGIFREMYAFIRREADIKGAAGLRLYVESNNTAAMKTYEALGMSNEHYRMYEWLREK